jgi:UDP-N-acetylmuramoyl-L-alanyl-D-glutamate--2,6-diaminopimelate ligase
MTWADLHGVLRDSGLVDADTIASASAAGVFVTGIADDSRSVEPGNVFVALKGQHADGTRFAADAIGRGAAAVVSEDAAPAGVGVPWTVVSDARRAGALLAAEFFEHPSAEMQVVGITGTNGKTTTAYLLASIFEAAGLRCGLLGTVVYRIGSEVRDATRTTPEAPEVQGLLREMVGAGCQACVMEVSSHALALSRVAGTVFAAGVFTNLSRDHLDFHPDMEAYFQAKRRLFESLPPDAPGVINVDDPRGASLIHAGGRPVTYALSRPADVTTGPLSVTLDGLSFDVRTPRGSIAIRSPLIGRPNAYNILAAVAAADALDIPADAITRGVRALQGVPGRFQVVSSRDDDVTVIVDYAHTDDALRNVLETVRPMARGRVLTVFGCGGDRDRTKRPLMGAVAGRLSDLIVVTSDNPRSEDPVRIIDEVCLGLTIDTRKDRAQRVLTIVDRRNAIATAIRQARAGDLVLIAGKGHEKYQVVGNRALPFDDVAAAREALMRRGSGSGVV